MDFNYKVTAITGAEADAMAAEMGITEPQKIVLTVPAVAPAFIVYNAFGRPWFGRDTRGSYWQRRIEGKVARMKRAYDKRHRWRPRKEYVYP